MASELSPEPPKKGSASVGGQDPDEADRLAHSPAADHLARDRGDLVDVGLSSGGDRPEDDLLGHPAAERDLDLAEQVLPRVGDLVVVGRRTG